MSRATRPPKTGFTTGILICCLLLAGGGLLMLSRNGRGLRGRALETYRVSRQTNLAPGHLYTFTNSFGARISADLASVVDIEADDPIDFLGSSVGFKADGQEGVSLAYLDSRPGVVTLGVPRGYRTPPKHAVITVADLTNRTFENLPLQPLPPAQKVLLSPKPDSRISAYRVKSKSGKSLIELRVNTPLGRGTLALGNIRGSTYTTYPPKPFWASNIFSGSKNDFYCDYIEDVQSLDVQMKKGIPRSVECDLVIPKARLSTVNGRTMLVPEAEATQPIQIGVVTADRKELLSRFEREPFLHLGFQVTRSDILDSSISYRWMSPDLDQLGLVGVLMPAGPRTARKDRERLEQLRGKPVYTGEFGPIRIHVKCDYHIPAPWFRVQIPVTDSKRDGSSFRFSYISPVGLPPE